MNKNKLYNIPFWIISVSFVLGVFVFSSKICSPTRLFVCVFLLLLLFVIIKKHVSSVIFALVSCVFFFLIGGLRYQLSIPENQPTHLIHQTNLEDSNKDALFTVTEIFKESEKWENYKISIKQIDSKSVSGAVLLKLNCEDNVSLKKGWSYIGYLKLNRIPKEKFPYGFNYNQYLKTKGITHQAWVKNNTFKSIPNLTNQWIFQITTLQNNFSKALKKQNLSSDVIQFTQALVLGNKRALDKKLSVNFINAGVIHILAISGLHIGIVYFLFAWLLKWFFYRYKYRVLRSVLVVLLLWLFVWFSGGSDSAVRAATMFVFFELSRLLLRSQHPINALVLTVFVLVLLSPKVLFSVGFQLSVVAVASIIIGVPKLLNWWNPKLKIVNYIWRIICVSLCAQIGLLPLSLYYFHQFPLLFLVANIPVMVGIPFIMGFSIIVVLFSYFDLLPTTIITFYNYCITCLIQFVEWVASIDAFLLKELYISKLTVAVIYILFLYLRWVYSNSKMALRYASLPLVLLTITSFAERRNQKLKSEVWLLNDYSNAMIVNITLGEVEVYSEKVLTDTNKTYVIKPILGELHLSKVSFEQLKQAYCIGNKKLLIVRDNYIHKLTNDIDILIVANSPKVNFKRLIQNLRPKLIVFGANNKRYLLPLWEKSCEEMGIPFYNVSKRGSLRLDAL